MIELGQRIIKIPVSSRLNPVDREQAQSIAQYVSTPDDARRLVNSDSDGPWALQPLDGLGHLFVLKYRGCHLRLIYQRQMLNEVIEQGYPVPPIAIQNSKQEWLAWNLVDDAEKQVNVQESKSEIASARQERDLVYRHLAEAKHRHESEKAELADELIKWKGLAAAAEKLIDKQTKQIETHDSEIKSMRGRMGLQVVKAKDEGMRKAVQELIPLINILSGQKDKLEWAKLGYNDAVIRLGILGLTVIAPEPSEVFDPTVHNAIEVLELSELELDGKIVECQSIGVKQGQIILRAADVIVAKVKTQPIVQNPTEEVS